MMIKCACGNPTDLSCGKCYQTEIADALRERDEARAERDARLPLTPEDVQLAIYGSGKAHGEAYSRMLAALRAHAERANKGQL